MTLIFRPAIVAAALLFTAALPSHHVQAESLAGSYLAASQANFENNYAASALYYTRALAADPDNLGLMQNVVLAYLSKGDAEKAVPIAAKMESLGANSQLAQLLLLTEAIRKENFADAAALFEKGASFSPLLDGLIRGWVDFGKGDMSAATAEFDEMRANNAMRVFSDYHRALMLAVVGDFEGSEKLLAGENGQPVRIGRGSLIAHIEVLSQLERNPDAIKVIEGAMNGSGDLEMLNLLQRLNAGETLPISQVSNPVEGAAEVFFTLASVLSGEDNDRFGLIYARLSEYLRPTSVESLLMVADMLSAQKQFDLAVESLNKVPSSHPEFYTAEIGRSEALQAAGKAEAAIEVLRGLTKTHKTIPTVFTSLGDALRRESRFPEATEAYNGAIALLPDVQPNHWFLYYARGITLEREGKWDAAEADFRFALKLSPDQPLVLNYLGYGMVEKNINLEEAQQMIETAVAKQPNDGYITDSLGWVLYRVGKFAEAVSPLEKAIELMPVDPIINDHLGDAYWMVGRKLEAAFQWRRALSFEPEEADAARIRLKLEIGLDAVMNSETE